MKIAGTVAEYNPFHLGHEYHLNTTRSGGQATHIVAVMSGNFVQRGTPSVCSKLARAEMAVSCGADLVIELPLPWASATAQRFAMGATALLDALGCVDMLSFGSENGNLEAIKEAVRAADHPQVALRLREYMDGGMTFAAARSAAMWELFPSCAELLSSPNDTLAVEYIRALGLLSSGIEPFAVQRKGACHDEMTADLTTASASYIRSLIGEGKTVDALSFMPDGAARVMQRELSAGGVATDISAFDTAVLSYLRRLSGEELAQLPDISEGLENKLYSAIRTSVCLEQLYEGVKSKRYTHARIRRIVLAAFLGVREDIFIGGIPYIRVLAMNKNGQEILAKAKSTAKLPIVTRARDINRLGEQAKRVFELECRSTDLYNLITKIKKPCGTDMTDGIIIL